MADQSQANLALVEGEDEINKLASVGHRPPPHTPLYTHLPRLRRPLPTRAPRSAQVIGRLPQLRAVVAYGPLSQEQNLGKVPILTWSEFVTYVVG
jgi:hypothetical protein